MRFALVNNKLMEAQLGLKGLCPGCSRPVVAKCGDQRIHHWAHLNNRMCDSWWEPETEWHRAWKNLFPVSWQESFFLDESTGEKHIADVCTDQGLVIEFQHSHINPQERVAREKFYSKLIWIVDASRLKRDFPRFLKAKKNGFRPVAQGIFRIDFPEECFPASWNASAAPVIFDFLGMETLEDITDARHDLYLLFPGRLRREALLAVVSRKAFLDAALNGKIWSWIRSYVDSMAQINQEFESLVARQQRIQDGVNFRKVSTALRYQKRRRRF